ncbi:MAG: peroxide stress protein YaaA [Lautropia sp.]|nr:peroxide stress protein YaaA [Lautropia sp.]
MKIVLSPAKSLDYTTPAVDVPASLPMFAQQTQQLVDIMRGYDVDALQQLMSISKALATENEARYQRFSDRHDEANSRPAIFAFDGDVYDGLAARTMSAAEAGRANRLVRILSGLYGVLRPFDRMQPYRLEMGTRLPNPAGKDLYAFWRGHVTRRLNEELDQDSHPVLINLASDEYFGAVDPKALRHPVVKIVFEEWRDDAKSSDGGKWKVVSFNAKRARGMMTRYAIDTGIGDPLALKGFDRDGYAFDEAVSTDERWVFRRKDWPPR